MGKKRMNKKGAGRGISPLIATVLIIGFVVMLAAVFFIWGGNFTKGLISRQEYKIGSAQQCGAVDFEVTVPEANEENCNRIPIDILGTPSDYEDDIVGYYLNPNSDKTRFNNKGSVPIVDFYIRINSKMFPTITVTLSQFNDEDFINSLSGTEKSAAEGLQNIESQLLPLQPFEIKSVEQMLQLVYLQELGLTGTVGAIEKLDLIPVVNFDGEFVSCSGKFTEVEIPRCPISECIDKLDNDGDGNIDVGDTDCHDSNEIDLRYRPDFDED